MLEFKGMVHVEHRRRGVLINKFSVPNRSTKQGMLQFLNGSVNFIVPGIPPRLVWDHRLIDGDFGISFSRDDTQASHPGWTQLGTFSSAAGWGTVKVNIGTEMSPVLETVAARRAIKLWSFFGDETKNVGGSYIALDNPGGTTNIFDGAIVSEVAFPEVIELRDSLDTLTIITILQIANTAPAGPDPDPLNHTLTLGL